MDWTPIIILAAICFVIGFISAVLIVNLRAVRDDQPASSPPPGDRLEVVKLLRDQESGELVPEIEGELLISASELTAEQHARLSIGLVDLYRWMEQGSVPPPLIKEASQTPAATPESTAGTDLVPDDEAPQAPPDEVPEAPAGEPSAAVQPQLEYAEPEQETVKPASVNVFKSLISVARSEINQKVEPVTPSIAAQVDEILQKKIAGTPLEERAIRLFDLPEGMVILVGMEKYDDVEQVPDEEIKKVLRASVAEWETTMLKKSKSNNGE